MRIGITFLWASLLVLTLAGCGSRPPPGGDGMEKRLADLEKGAAAMQEQNRDLRAKLRAAHTFGRSPLQDFLARRVLPAFEAQAARAAGASA